MLKKLFSLMLLVVSFQSLAFAGDWHDLPDGICAKYAAQEFEKIASAPGVNWLNTNYDWVPQAHDAGWVVKTDVHDAREGAVVEWQGLDRDGGHVAIVRKVLADKIIVEEQNVGKTTGTTTFNWNSARHTTEVTEGWGKTTQRAIPYTALIKMDKKKFMGYIWPVRQDDYDKNPAKYNISITDQMNIKEPLYKGFREYWSTTYILKEFDKIAPAPGVNWHGHVETWLTAAQKSGWLTTTDPADSQIGALLIKVNAEKKHVKVGIVRSIDSATVTIDERSSNLYPFSQTIKLDELKAADKDGFTFLGYILPVRS